MQGCPIPAPAAAPALLTCFPCSIPPCCPASRLDTLFRHLTEYLSTDALDLLVCAHASAAVQDDGRLLVRVQGGANGASPRKGGAAGDTAATIGSGDGVWPLYFVNDVSLLQLLETSKLVMDY